MSYKRSSRVAGLLKREVSRIIFEDIKDPRIGLVTITQVDVSEDLRTAKIYLSVLGDKVARDQTLQGLERAKKFIRMEIARTTELRYTPELKFYYDDSYSYAENIENLLKKIKVAES